MSAPVRDGKTRENTNDDKKMDRCRQNIPSLTWKREMIIMVCRTENEARIQIVFLFVFVVFLTLFVLRPFE